MRTVQSFLVVLAGAALLSLFGCGGGGNRCAPSGGVKFRGQPLDQGAITFLPEDPSLGAGGGAMIKDGRYDIPARSGLPPGRYKVMITSADASGATDPDALPGPAGPLPRDRI